MEAINDSLKNVAKSAEMVKSFLELGSMDNEALLQVALELLEKTVDILSESVD
jgi:hypothetical protein